MNALDTWFGALPREWRSSPIKADFAIQLGKMLQPGSRGGDDRQTTYLRAANVQWDGVRLGQAFLKSMYASQSDLVQYAAVAGDVLVVEGGEGGRTCLMVEDRDDLIIQNSLLRLRPKDLSSTRSRFLVKVMRAANAAGYFAAANNGSTISHFTKVKCAVMPVPTPPDDLMKMIVRYLDHAEVRIAKAIAAKQELLSLLNEHRSTVIDTLVLRGLDPESEMSTSNVAWIGEIPAHWEVVSSKSLFAHRKERSRVGDEMLTASQSRGILKREEFMALEGRRVMQVLVGSDILKHVEPNDFVISMRSFQGGLEWSKVSGCISSAYVMLIPGQMVHCEYFALLLKSKAYVSALRTTSDLVRDGQALRYANFCQLQLPLPPLEEQRRIAAVVDEKVASLDRAIDPVLNEIALLKEYRTRLISDVVTGKLDVRDEAAKLPDIDPKELATVSVGENGDEEEATDDD
jgi:type I restriction enzyme, S subunit